MTRRWCSDTGSRLSSRPAGGAAERARGPHRARHPPDPPRRTLPPNQQTPAIPRSRQHRSRLEDLAWIRFSSPPDSVLGGIFRYGKDHGYSVDDREDPLAAGAAESIIALLQCTMLVAGATEQREQCRIDPWKGIVWCCRGGLGHRAAPIDHRDPTGAGTGVALSAADL